MARRVAQVIDAWRLQVLDLALALAAGILALAILTTALQGGAPGRLLAMQLTPGLLVVLVGLGWRDGPLAIRGLCMLGGYWAAVIAAGLTRGYGIPNPWVGAMFVCVLSALVFDRRSAWAATAITVLIWVGVSVPWVTASPDGFADPTNPSNWARVVVIFALFSGAAVGGILYMVTRLEEAMRRSESLLEALGRESEQRLTVQRERHQLELRLQKAQKLEALGTMAGSMAHDVNNLLQTIAGHTDAAFEMGGEDQRLKAIAELEVASSRAARLTRQLLAFSRHQASEGAELDVAFEVGHCVRLLEPLVPALELHEHHEGELPTVFGPSTAVQQIVMNLALNARDAMPGGGQLWVSTELVLRERDGVEGRFALVTVRDDGPGMDEATLERLFDPFFTTKGSGTGLGLQLVRSLAEAVGGFVEVTSAPGLGTEVRVYLAEQAPQVAPPPPVDLPSGGRILVVDDDPAVLRVLVRFLNFGGYEVVEASGGAQALAVYQRDPSSFSAVVSDALMPEMGGRELYDELVALTPELRFLVCSGYSADVFEPGFFDSPRRHFLGKPFRAEELLGALRELLAAA